MSTATASKAQTEGRNDINIRSSVEFTAWVGRIAANQRISVASLIELALIDYAERLRFDEDAPIRLARDRRHGGEN